jgi:hypothetical protein
VTIDRLPVLKLKCQPGKPAQPQTMYSLHLVWTLHNWRLWLQVARHAMIFSSSRLFLRGHFSGPSHLRWPQKREKNE